ncbi:hypothetical protein ACWEP3_19925, partial [Streptomyces albidoflavus]
EAATPTSKLGTDLLRLRDWSDETATGPFHDGTVPRPAVRPGRFGGGPTGAITGEVGFAREPEPLTPWGHTSPRSAPNESDPQDHQP